MKIKEKWVSHEELTATLGGAAFSPSIIDAGIVGGLTAGSIPFADATGFLTEDNANFFWDAAEKNLGIGTNTFGANMAQGLQIATGVAPTANVADTFAFYSADFAAGNACPHFRTENGTVIGLNQSLFTTDNVTFGTIGCGTITVANGSSINLQEDITFTGATAQNLIKFPDNLVTALSFREGANAYLTFKTTDAAEAVIFGKVFTGVSGSTIGNLTLANGSITDSSGAISFGNENISTTGTLGAGITTLAGLTVTDYIYFDKDVEHVAMFGFEAGHNAAAGGQYNTFIGESAGYSLTTGDKNFFCGFEAGYYNQTGVENFYAGYRAGKGALNQSHSYNTFIGSEAGLSITTGTNNTFIGRQAGKLNTTGEQNVAIGQAAMRDGLDCDFNVCIGYGAGIVMTGNYQVMIGAEAGFLTTSGGGSVYIGYKAGRDCTTYGENVAIGTNAMENNVQAGNVVIGYQAGILGTAYYNAVFIGWKAGYSNTGNQNVYVGENAGYSGTSANFNTFIGDNAGRYEVAGDKNTFVGCQAGYGHSAKTNHDNTLVGYQAGYSLDGGANYNTCIGLQAGHDITTGDQNVCLGYKAGDGQITTQSHQLWIANSDTATPLIYGEFPNTLLRINAPLDIGRDGALRGALTLWDGAGGNTPGYARIYSPNGTAWYIFVEDDGTVKVHNAVPAANADGDAIGDQTD